MSLPVPKLDDRAFDDLIEEAKRRILATCPQWTDFNASDPGMTLVDVMAWMTEIILYRLNRVPERNYIKLLELMGLRLKPAEPARAWVKFNVTGSEAKDQVVKAGTVLSTARKEGEEPVPFETAAVLYLTTTHLIRVYSQVGEEVTDHTPGLEGITVWPPPRGGAEGTSGAQPGPTPIKREPIFHGQTRVPHILYLGDSRLDFGDPRLAAVLQLRVLVELTDNLTGPVDIEWERWDGVEWAAVHPAEDGTRGLRQSGALVFEKLPKANLEGKPADANLGKYVLRARLVGGRPTTLPTLKSVKRGLEVNPTQQLFPDKVVHSAPKPADPAKPYIPYREIDPSHEFAPFGAEPREEDTLYLRSAAFGRRGATVTITVKKSEHYNPAEGLNLELVWEYFARSGGWKELRRSRPNQETRGEEEFDETKALTRGGRIRFIIPSDVAAYTLQGDSGPYIRVRIATGSYGADPKRAPVLSALSVHFADPLEDWQHYVAENYLQKTDLTAEFTAHRPVQPFVMQTEQDPALYLGFTEALPNNLQRFYVALATPSDAPAVQLQWEYWSEHRWAQLQVVDGTKAFSQNGAIEFIGPARWTETKRFGQQAYWLRCRLELGDMRASAEIEGIHVNTVEVVQGRSFRDEIVGSSTGEPFQTFRLIWTPVLPGSEILVREKQTYAHDELERLRTELGVSSIVEDGKDGWWIRWREVESFFETEEKDRHYTLDPHEGIVTFGDGRRGMIPPQGANNIKANVYQQTAGARGNVGANTITVLDGRINGVDKVFNLEPAGGGADAESIENAKLRGPYELKTRQRAVTAEDFEYLAVQASGQVAKAKCFSQTDPVQVVIVPKGGPKQERLRPPGRLVREVQEYLDRHRLMTARVRVMGPYYDDIWLSVEVVPVASHVDRFPELRTTIVERLRTFVHPLPGRGHGPQDDGWPMGRTLHISELFYVLERVPGVDYVDKLTMRKWEDPESQDNIYIGDQAFPYFREVEVKQAQG